MKMGSASFRNCTLTQIEKIWPTLSSGDILRNVLSTHFRPALSMWIGPGCRKRSLLLSLAKQSAAASRIVTSRRCRSMQLTIAKTGGNVLQQLHSCSRLIVHELSNLLLDGCNALRLDVCVIAESG